MKKQHRQALAIWPQASKEHEAQQQAQLKGNEPSARQKRGYVVLYVHRADQAATTIAQDDVDTVKENNFVCLPADRKKPAILVLRKFKTAK
ncbi:TPA: hypothetical protein ACH3X2_000289 [Trebouxia sp. C0005]